MPSKSQQQRKLMAAACSDPKVARQAGVPQSVACEFARADKRKSKSSKGGKKK